MTELDTAAILENGAVLTKHGAIVDLELEGDCGLFFMSNVSDVLNTNRKRFDSRTDRDNALLNTVQQYIENGWQLAGGES